MQLGRKNVGHSFGDCIGTPLMFSTCDTKCVKRSIIEDTDVDSSGRKCTEQVEDQNERISTDSQTFDACLWLGNRTESSSTQSLEFGLATIKRHIRGRYRHTEYEVDVSCHVNLCRPDSISEKRLVNETVMSIIGTSEIRQCVEGALCCDTLVKR